jgi:hypothetical protein
VPQLDLLHRHGPLRGLGFGLIGCGAVPIKCDPPAWTVTSPRSRSTASHFSPMTSGTENTERWFPPDPP